ncbi:hypothetical protein V8C26DRAFT_395497 [Trichoderma gracile]
MEIRGRHHLSSVRLTCCILDQRIDASCHTYSTIRGHTPRRCRTKSLHLHDPSCLAIRPLGIHPMLMASQCPTVCSLHLAVSAAQDISAAHDVRIQQTKTGGHSRG